MSGIESEALFARPALHLESFGQFSVDSELAAEESRRQAARAQGQLALFSLGVDGMYVTQELF